MDENGEVMSVVHLRGCMAEKVWGRGQGVKIACIDSGINPWHPHINSLAGGIGFTVKSDGRILATKNYHDELGHGTAVAGVIMEQVPEAKLWSVKIFHQTLSTYMEVLCTAIEWCIEERMDLVNLSLGIRRDAPELKLLCEQAADEGVLIVTACDEQNNLVWPGYYDSVFGVRAGQHCSSDVFFYHPEQKPSFHAFGLPRELAGPMQKFNFQGHSFAAAHVTGYLAKLKEHFNITSKEEMERVLHEVCMSEVSP